MTNTTTDRAPSKSLSPSRRFYSATTAASSSRKCFQCVLQLPYINLLCCLNARPLLQGAHPIFLISNAQRDGQGCNAQKTPRQPDNRILTSKWQARRLLQKSSAGTYVLLVTLILRFHCFRFWKIIKRRHTLGVFYIDKQTAERSIVPSSPSWSSFPNWNPQRDDDDDVQIAEDRVILAQKDITEKPLRSGP